MSGSASSYAPRETLASARVRGSEVSASAKWASFFEERTRLKNEEEALCDRADELDRQWEQFVIERETWGEYLAVREDVRRAELTEDSDALIADQEAWGDGWAELAARVEKDWAERQPK